MTRAGVLLLLALSSACAARSSSPSPPEPFQYVFSEVLAPETRVCVTRTPFVAELSCMPLYDLRQWLRRRQLARLEGEP